MSIKYDSKREPIAEIIRKAGHQRALRSDDDKIDLFRLAEGNHRPMVGDLDIGNARHLADAGPDQRQAVEALGATVVDY